MDHIGFVKQIYPLSEELTGKFGLSIIQREWQHGAVVETPRLFEVVFDSEEAAGEFAARWIRSHLECVLEGGAHRKGCSGVAATRAGDRVDPFDWDTRLPTEIGAWYKCVDPECNVRIHTVLQRDHWALKQLAQISMPR